METGNLNVGQKNGTTTSTATIGGQAFFSSGHPYRFFCDDYLFLCGIPGWEARLLQSTRMQGGHDMVDGKRYGSRLEDYEREDAMMRWLAFAIKVCVVGMVLCVLGWAAASFGKEDTSPRDVHIGSVI